MKSNHPLQIVVFEPEDQEILQSASILKRELESRGFLCQLGPRVTQNLPALAHIFVSKDLLAVGDVEFVAGQRHRVKLEDAAESAKMILAKFQSLN
jgi:hypothetical protein